jgi:hypothetical protein
MEVLEIESNGQKFIFNVVKNETEPCSKCGVLAYGKEDILWYEDKEQRIAVIFDGGYFDLAGEEFFDKNIKTIEYGSLPIFMREWNEARGWTDCWDYNGYELGIDDFLKSLELLRNCEMGKWITTEDINSMEELANNAKEIGAKLKIVRG